MTRSNNGTAQAGSVASAIRFIAKAVLGGVTQEFLSHDISKVRAHLSSDKGIGQTVIVDFLSSVPGITNATVQQALANLKSSGNYARIIGEVRDEIERENREALAALAKCPPPRSRPASGITPASRKLTSARLRASANSQL